MSLPSLFNDLAAYLQSTEFLATTRHPDHPTAFTRRWKLPLASLVALMLSGMRKSIQAELDTFFAHFQHRLSGASPQSEISPTACKKFLKVDCPVLLGPVLLGSTSGEPRSLRAEV